MAQPDRAVVEGLITRLQTAKGPDREVDFAVFRCFNPEYAGPEWQPFGGGLRHVNDSSDMRCQPPPEATPAWITASQDAALTLINRLLPGMDITLQFPGIGADVERPTARVRFDQLSSMEDDAETMPLAILAAGLGAFLCYTGAPDAR